MQLSGECLMEHTGLRFSPDGHADRDVRCGRDQSPVRIDPSTAEDGLS